MPLPRLLGQRPSASNSPPPSPTRTSAPDYEPLTPDKDNWFWLLPWTPRHGYSSWPAVNELCAEDPMLGLNENRQVALIDHDRDALTARMQQYLDPDVPMAEVDPRLRTDVRRL